MFREVVSALCASAESLRLLDVEVVVQKVWVCLLPEWEHQRGGRGGEGRRRGRYVCALTASAERE